MNRDERIVAAQGILNFRDYGGYPAMGGSRLKRGILFRSAQHKNATDQDLCLLPDNDIRTVIDLRGDGERTDHPCRRHSEFTGRVVFVPGETVNPAKSDGALDSAEAAMVRMRRSYAEMPFRPLLKRAFALYFKSLVEEEGGSLVHCLAGKDRTGMAVALFHHILGVHPDDAIADYLLTNDVAPVDQRIESGADVIRARNGPSVPIEAIRVLMTADASYLSAAFNAIVERHGTVDTYMETELGVGPEARVALSEKYLA